MLFNGTSVNFINRYGDAYCLVPSVRPSGPLAHLMNFTSRLISSGAYLLKVRRESRLY